MLFSQSVTQAVQNKKTPSTPSRRQTYDLLITSPDALPLSYRRLKVFKATKLGNSTFFSEQTFHFGCLILNQLHDHPKVFLWVGQSCFLFMHDLYSFDMITEYCSHFNVIIKNLFLGWEAGHRPGQVWRCTHQVKCATHCHPLENFAVYHNFIIIIINNELNNACGQNCQIRAWILL